ncbi:MAG: Helix-turn-helix domain [Verrucomicrobiales bacterium]|nr:Helix-turn-helix domain [Verrucomicrobiales bacterium]
MVFCRHIPGKPLSWFVDWFWFYEDHCPNHRRENVLPDGTFELVINLREETRKLFDREADSQSTSFRGGWVSGTHSGYITIDAVPRSSMIGVHFKPGGMAMFLGRPADELRDQVVQIDALWGKAGLDLRERLLTANDPHARFKVLETFLLGRLAPARADRDGRISWAVSHFSSNPQGRTIRALANGLGISHKHFISEFRERVGITPKLFCRIQRFQQVLSKIKAQHSVQ